MIKSTNIKIGELFNVEKKLYVIVKPTTATQDANEHDQIILILHKI